MFELKALVLHVQRVYKFEIKRKKKMSTCAYKSQVSSIFAVVVLSQFSRHILHLTNEDMHDLGLNYHACP